MMHVQLDGGVVRQFAEPTRVSHDCRHGRSHDSAQAARGFADNRFAQIDRDVSLGNAALKFR